MHEIFISYCHDDNEKLLFLDVGWVDVFFDTLKKRIAVNSPRDQRPEIWIDHKRIEGNSVLSSEIESGLREAMLLVPVISPSYVSSDWCKVELQTFCQLRASQSTLVTEGKSRVFKVIKNEIEGDVARVLNAIPGIADSTGYEFFENGREINPLLARSQAEEFADRINKLAKELLKTLGSLRPATVGSSVFLGNASKDMAEQTEQLRKELEMFGNTVVRVPPDEDTSPVMYRKKLRDALATCRLAIQPVGASYGTVPDGYDISPFIMQFEEASAEAQRRPDGFTQLSWMLPDTTTTQERQLQFIAQLEGRGPQFHRLSIEDFKTRVRDVIAGPPAPTPLVAPVPDVARPAAARTAARKPSVYLICDQKDDEGQIEALVELLQERSIVDRSLLEREITALAVNRGDDLEAQLRKDHQENLSSDDAVIIYHGAGDQLWLRAKLRELRNAPGYGRARPFAATAILLAPPMRDDKQSYDNPDIRIVTAFEAPKAADLDPFFADIARSFELAG